MSLANSFWTQDYESGFRILFDQLYQGVSENEDFVQLFTKRMESELLYGTQLEAIEKSVVRRSSKRQNNDDYVSSIKNAFQKVNENFTKQGELHLQIASNIKLLVLEPFEKWCKEHKQRVEYSESVILDKNKVFKNAKHSLEKLQKRYFNKCRMLEEFKSHYGEDELNEELKDFSFSESIEKGDSKEEENIEDEEDSTKYQIAGTDFDHRSLKQLLKNILNGIELASHKVPILGTYQNVSTGSAITQWLLDNREDLNRNIVKAEQFGQGLVNLGFIRLIGTMGNKNFINSSQFYYQWKPIVFELTKLTNMETAVSGDDVSRETSLVNKAQFQDYFDDVKEAIGVGSVDYSDISQLSKLISEVNQLDSHYYKKAVELDKIRCDYEELIMDHLTFMQKCEFDRLKAIKKVTFDFLSSFANKVTSMKSACDELLILEETINPTNDLKFLIENYATGNFKPHVILYDNYYNSNINQTFGVDLSVKSRLDRKVVPIIIQSILSHLDKVYPGLANDEERINLWTHPIHLSNVHSLRFQINNVNDPSIIQEILSQVHPMIITNVLKLYFMELPDSVVPHSYYDLIKSLYQNYPVNDPSKTNHRINGLQNVLVDLPKSNLATLDAILTHLNRLIQIIGAKDGELANSLQVKLSKEFGSLILRPKVDSMNVDISRNLHNDKHQINFINDLFENKETIFKELRRRNSTRQVNSNTPSREPSVTSRLTPRSSLVASSKSRLESKFQSAIHRTKKTDSSNKFGSASDENGSPSYDSEADSTPPPITPKKAEPNSLKRSTSPNKKKLNTLLSEEKLSVVSSRSPKKDNSGDSGNGSISDLAQPAAPSLSRKTSVRNSASHFDSPSSEVSEDRAESPSREAKLRKDSKSEVIVVD
ncbi:predicted protein [Scheffersomyces stipitis CBS 6054]|uniref:Rho-GTPase-activating protein RGD2 n=1 Tax=Scheffersomyces stipitis (strain ATCC 58785 / CBS 6054 / NBRC 10063 / NRRL Y-11545) TaxID=322104 RepID=A3LYV4_PICST|nr:predicted protein [Scheffersomyces stipitis CBS 6054]ABN68232.2 predicted protein [Scheffersomyces stipitis CBS 6054]KAG2731312.1 hypothetical protein G9P44_005728 [Scheffersomyces stipitis]